MSVTEQVELGRLIEKVDALAARIDTGLSALQHQMNEVKKQTTETNGRVRSLEKWQARLEGASAVGRPLVLNLAFPVIVGIVVGVVVAVAAGLIPG